MTSPTEDHVRRYGTQGEHRPALEGVEKYLAGEELFLANYSDGLTNSRFPR